MKHVKESLWHEHCRMTSACSEGVTVQGCRECSGKGRASVDWSWLLGQGCRRAEAEGPASWLEHVHDGVVQLREHHKVDGKAGSAVLGGRIAREPGKGIVLLQYKP